MVVKEYSGCAGLQVSYKVSTTLTLLTTSRGGKEIFMCTVRHQGQYFCCYLKPSGKENCVEQTPEPSSAVRCCEIRRKALFSIPRDGRYDIIICIFIVTTYPKTLQTKFLSINSTPSSINISTFGTICIGEFYVIFFVLDINLRRIIAVAQAMDPSVLGNQIV